MKEFLGYCIVSALLGFGIAALIACEARDSERVRSWQYDIDAMTFVRHKDGLCFGVIRFDVYNTSVVHLPSEFCEAKK